MKATETRNERAASVVKTPAIEILKQIRALLDPVEGGWCARPKENVRQANLLLDDLFFEVTKPEREVFEAEYLASNQGVE